MDQCETVTLTGYRDTKSVGLPSSFSSYGSFWGAFARTVLKGHFIKILTLLFTSFTLFVSENQWKLFCGLRTLGGGGGASRETSQALPAASSITKQFVCFVVRGSHAPEHQNKQTNK